jgi:PAS domain S-box-containing protein
MEWARMLYTLPLYLTAALAFSYFLYALRNRPSPIAIPFAALMLSIIIWASAYALELSSSSYAYQLFWMRLGYFGKLCLPVAFLWFIYEFARSKRNYLKPFLPVIFLESLLVYSLVWTSNTQSLFFKSVEQIFISPLYLLNILHGPVFWLQTSFIYLLLATGSYILFKDLWNLTPSYRNRFLIIVLSLALPIIANLITIFRLSPMPQLDLTPYTFLIIELIILWGIIHFHFLEIMTFAQQTIVENTNDAILVVDEMDKVIYSNQAACVLLGFSKVAMLGKRVTEVWPDWSELIGSDSELEISTKTPDIILHREILQGEDTNQRWYRLKISYLNDQGGMRLGKLVMWNDITASKQTDEVYQFGQKRLGQLVDNSPNPIFSIDRQGKIRSWSPACETSFQYGKEIIGQEYYLLLPPQDRTILGEMLAKIFDHGESIDKIDIEYLCKDGSTLHMASRLYPLLDQAGETDICIIANTDVTDREHAQETLRRQFEELRVLHLVATACMDAMNEDALIEKVTEIIGVTFFPDNFGILLFDETDKVIRRHPSYRERVENLPYDAMPFGRGITSQTILTGQPMLVADVSLDPTYFEVDGLTRSELCVPLKTSERVIGVINTESTQLNAFTDSDERLLTILAGQLASTIERLRAGAAEQHRTQEQARQVQMIIDTVPEGVLLLDVNHRVILANPAARKYLSVLLRDFEYDQPLSQLADQPIARLLEVSAERSWRELLVMGEQNQIFELAAQPLEIAAEISGWVLVLRDVTEERANLTRIQMQERLATVGQLAAGIAHDFNNIMAAIVVYTDLLAIDPELNSENHGHIKIIQQQIQRAASLIRQILDFSRRSIMEPSSIDLLPFIKELDKLLGRILPENILLRLSFSPGIYMIRADPTSLQQIFMNLALNARDAMSAGGILQFALSRLSISENEHPPLPELTPGNWVRLLISDNGIGIPENTLLHIFDPFYTTKPVGKGTGLGLAQVYGIVKQHGGSIDVQSVLGEGTTFRLYFPELPMPDEQPVASSPGSIPRGEGETVLVVEDDTATREALQYLLESQNYNVYTAQDGIEALRLYDQTGQHFDLVVSDIVMPGMGGLMLYSVLREREPNLRMLFITGHPLELENQTLLEESRLNWLQKPFSMQEFIRAIRLALINFS